MYCNLKNQVLSFRTIKTENTIKIKITYSNINYVNCRCLENIHLAGYQ